jgi:polysaccharide export outer membrane protein
MNNGAHLRFGVTRRSLAGLLLAAAILQSGCASRPRMTALGSSLDGLIPVSWRTNRPLGWPRSGPPAVPPGVPYSELVPREHNRVSLPTYRVAPPDILLIEAVNNLRPASTRLTAGDVVTIRLQNGLPLEGGGDLSQDPLQLEAKRQTELQYKIINGPYVVRADGMIDLGPTYGEVAVEGLTIDQAKAALVRHLHDRVGVADPKLSVVLADMSGKQVISGEHLVRPDGTVGLGIYGDVHVAGMTLAEIRMFLGQYLSQFLHDPLVSVDVLAYNSRVYYLIMDGGGYGEQIVRLPCTGNETILDAVAQIEGLSQVSSKCIWIARPCPSNVGQSQILRVNWDAITAGGIAATNYQLLPGDRIYVKADPMIATDNYLAKWLAPFDRVLGSMLLGTTTAQRIQFYKQFGQQGGSGGGGSF